MRYYIATKLSNHAMHRALRERIDQELRWTLTYDWTTHGSVKDTDEAIIRRVAKAEVRGVTSAHLVIAILPGGRGTHAEIGIALGAKVPVVLWTNHADADLLRPGEATCAFYHAPTVWHVVGSLPVLMEQLKAWSIRS